MKAKVALALATAAASQSVLAHPGHDHSHWLSNPIHALSVLAAAAIIGTAVYAIAKKKQAEK
jgi:hypothetical protein